MSVNDLILAVLSELTNLGAPAPSKTKLLKLLYLIDIEATRSTGKTLTSWSWVFLHFGPWAVEYDNTLDVLANRDDVVLRGFGTDETTTLIVTQRRDRSAEQLGDGTVQNVVARVLNRWGDRPLGEILDFVYFETEPMKQAERSSMLDFSLVPRGRYPMYYRVKGDGAKKTLREMRSRLNRAVSSPEAHRPYTEPRYDDAFEQALAVLEDD